MPELRRNNHMRSDGLPKAGFRSLDGARAARRRLIEQAGVYGPSLHCYPCGVCGLWHVGRKLPPTGRRKRNRMARSA